MTGLASDFAQWPATERDAAYNNSAAVSDSTAQLAAFDQRSAAFVASVEGERDVRYGPADRQLLDYFPGRPGAATLLFIHGGYWQMRHKDTFRFVLQGAHSHGFHTAMVGYSLAPQASLRQIVGEVEQGIAAVRAHNMQLDGSGALVLCGWSAGGHLAALGLGCDGVVAGLGISGIYDLAPIQRTYLNQALALSDEEVQQLSPLKLPPVDKPFYTAYGTAELSQLQAQSLAFATYRLRCRGHACAVAGAHHFSILDALADPEGLLLKPLLTHAGR